jgi:hypothetical protein
MELAHGRASDEKEGKLPESLAVVPKRQGYINRITDAWGRPLIYKITENGFTHSSLGKDGKEGGEDDDADQTGTYRIEHGAVEEIYTKEPE